MSPVLTEGAGYLASLLLAISLLMTDRLRFRWFNAGGCLAFVVYGFFIDAIPVILTNGGLFIINVVALVNIYRKKENFDLLEVGPDSKLVEKFLQFYAADVKTYFPDYTGQPPENAIRFMVLRNLNLATVFVATLTVEGTALVQLNYTAPAYRDDKLGRFIFEKEKQYLKARGLKKLVYAGVPHKSHQKFLLRMGFQREHAGAQEQFVKWMV